MAKEFFKNLPDTSTPLTATRFNGLLDGGESQGNLVVESIKSKNAFNPSTVFNGYINTSNNTIEFETSGDRYSGFAKVLPNTTYTISKVVGHSFRVATITNAPINGVAINQTTANHTGTSITITTGANDNYLVVFFYSSSNGDTGGYSAMANTIQVEIGSSVSTYTSYNAYGSSNLKDEDVVVGSIRSKNVINTNAFLGMNGGSGSFEQLKTGARIITGNTGSNQWANFLLPNDLLGKKCTFSLKASASSSNVPMARIFYGSPTNMTNTTANFDLYGTGLKSKTETFLSTLPSGCTNIYMILYSNRDGSGFSAGAYSDFENLQLEIGEEQTSYSPYQDLENQEIYSVGEIKIGNWINGKPLYRKTVTVNSIDTSNNYIDVSHGISNMSMPISVKGIAKITGVNQYRPLGCMFINTSGNLDSQYVFNVYAVTESAVTLSYGNWWKTRFDRAYITLEYAKTTD